MCYDESWQHILILMPVNLVFILKENQYKDCVLWDCNIIEADFVFKDLDGPVLLWLDL